MTIYKKELKQSLKSLCIWTGSIAFMTLICMLLYPEMKNEMDSVSDIFANMGGFTAAFGMDKLSFGNIMGFYGIECGNIFGLGGGFFAAMTGISALAKEEKEHTAEFLLTHPKSRMSITGEKLFAVLTQIVILNVVVIGISAISIVMIGEKPDMKTLTLLFFAYFLLQIETAAICFGISAFLRSGGIGIGLGLAAIFYFLNIIANLTEKAEFLKYITPFGYTEGADIIAEKALNGGYLAVGAMLTVLGIGIAFYQYNRKDIA